MLVAAGSFVVVSAMVGMTVMMVRGSMIGRMSACITHNCGGGSMVMEAVAMVAVEYGIGGKSEAKEEHQADEPPECESPCAHE